MPSPSPANLRAFVRRQTRLQPVPDVPGVRLHCAHDVMEMAQLAGTLLGQADPPLPFWAFPWAGGLGVARYLLDHPGEVAGTRVLDVATGSGLLAIVALRCGAASVHAVDVDPLAEASVAVNARANGVRIGFSRVDLLSAPPPPCDVILAGDVCYRQDASPRIERWLRTLAARGAHVLLGDPGRRFLPAGLELLATYRVRTSRELEDADTKETAVYTIPVRGGDRAGA